MRFPCATQPIETAVTLGMVFGLASRQTEGVLRSLLELVADVHGPRARGPTFRRHRYRGRRKARYRLGGLTPGRAGFAPARRLLEVS